MITYDNNNIKSNHAAFDCRFFITICIHCCVCVSVLCMFDWGSLFEVEKREKVVERNSLQWIRGESRWDACIYSFQAKKKK